MAADLSRIRHDPLLDWAGVELQQGRVLLDADANELVAVLDRRLRALASDTLGRTTVSSTTPDAFRLGLVAGALAIGRGRMYVDGLLAENHGAASTDPAKRRFDPLLAESAFTDDTPYASQPYLPNPPALPTGGRHLVYLDVWQREVTPLERPELVETAVGVETTTRLQTVWQVRTLAEEAGGGSSCASPDADLPGWAELIAPSSGRLTTGSFEVPPVDDPCELPPTGGYRGLENQLYRVEIHDAGQPGAGASFKWSRENASVGSRVAVIVSATVLELESLGRDDVLRFNTGDWVEVLDDAREFSQAPGEMRRITVDEANRRIAFAPALPAAMLPAAFPDSTRPRTANLRVRRWDHKGRVFRTGAGGTTVQVQDLDAAGSSGVINVPAVGTSLLLENGVTVSFTSTGAKGFRRGDWWAFAARTSDASVELLDRAPPRGTQHHYARLGLWDLAAGAITDCRTPWPPRGDGHDCACGACVTPESHADGTLTIQAAVDALRETGGTVCLAVGRYALREPVRIAGARSLRIRGQGAASLITAPGGAFAIERSAGIAIERLAVTSLGAEPAIAARSVAGLAFSELLLLVLGVRDGIGAGIALGGVIAGLSIADNLIVAPDGIVRLATPAPDQRVAFLALAAARIERNVLWCQRRGIAFDGLSLHLFTTAIEANEVVGCRDGGVAVTGLAGPGAALQVRGNGLQVNGAGIASSLDGSWIADNKLHAVRQGDRQPDGAGITLAIGLDANGSDQAQLLANQVRGFPDGGIVVRAPVKALIVKLNIVEACGAGIVMLDDGAAGAVAIENNQLRDIGPLDDARSRIVLGIALARVEAATVAGNTLAGVGRNAVAAALRVGIFGIGVLRARVSGNELSGIGPEGDFVGLAAGVLLRGPYRSAEVSHNRIERDEAPAGGAGGNSAWQAVRIDEPAAASVGAVAGAAAAAPSGATTFRAAATLRLDAARVLVLNGNRAYIDAAAAAAPRAVHASLLGNTLGSRGVASAVEVSAAGDLRFCDNRCEQRSGAPAVRLASAAVVLNANRVLSGDISIDVVNSSQSVAAVGNICSGLIRVGGNPLPAPWNALNLQA